MIDDKETPAVRVKIQIDEERFSNSVTVDELIAMQEGNVRTIKTVLAGFVWTGSGYMDPEEAAKIIGKFTVRQLMETAKSFLKGAEEKAVPPANSPD